MYNLRFSVYALKLLIEFKHSKEMFPSSELLLLFADLLMLPDTSLDPAEYLARESFEYFYSGKRNGLDFEEFSKRINEWSVQNKVKIISAQIHTADKNISSTAFFIVADNSVALKINAIQKMRLECRKMIAMYQKERLCIKKKLFVDISEDIIDGASEEVLAGKGMLAFATKRGADNLFPQKRTKTVAYGKMYKNAKTLRVDPRIQNKVRMVFYKLHFQVRPAYYNIKVPSPYKNRRNSLAKLLLEHEYENNSDEEWIEGDGEDIEEESFESDEDEEGDQEWIEPDAEYAIFRKGQLPRIDYPYCREYALSEESKLNSR